jgi:hypothetical protein
LECADTSALSKAATCRRSPQRRRRGISVERPPKKSASSAGAAYSDDVAPEQSFWKIEFTGYKDFAPTALADLSNALHGKGESFAVSLKIRALSYHLSLVTCHPAFTLEP